MSATASAASVWLHPGLRRVPRGGLDLTADQARGHIDVLDLSPGGSATRADVGSPWNTSV